MGAQPGLCPVQHRRIPGKQQLAERQVGRDQGREAHGCHQEYGRHHGQDTLRDHINSFSLVLPSYNEATNGAYPL